MYRSNVHTLQYLDTAGSEPACKLEASQRPGGHGLSMASGGRATGLDGRAQRHGPIIGRHARKRKPGIHSPFNICLSGIL
jgi:hypothetical protein